MRRRPCGRFVLLAAAALAGTVGPAFAQKTGPLQTPGQPALGDRAAGFSFLFLNQERILTDSVAGQAILAAEEAEREALRAEARAIDSAFEEEERRLTEQKAQLTPEAFRGVADDFDTRVVEARREQDARSASLAQEFDQRRRQFYATVAPILVALMTRYEAKAIFDESSILLADQAVNITEAVIAEIDARAGRPDAGPVPETEPGPEPEPEPEPARPGTD